MIHTCLHCALAHALRVHASAMLSHGLTVSLGRSEPVWLPITGARIYRALCRLLADVATVATPGPVKVSVVDMCGKAHIEVTVTVRAGARVRVLSCAFPRQVEAALSRGFVEGIG